MYSPEARTLNQKEQEHDAGSPIRQASDLAIYWFIAVIRKKPHQPFRIPVSFKWNGKNLKSHNILCNGRTISYPLLQGGQIYSVYHLLSPKSGSGLLPSTLIQNALSSLI